MTTTNELPTTTEYDDTNYHGAAAVLGSDIRETYANLYAYARRGRQYDRPIAHNTRIRIDTYDNGDRERNYRETVADVVIRYHATDVITYRGFVDEHGRAVSDGTVVLRARGWHTVTTAKRFRDWLPSPFRGVSNDRGSWSVFVSGDPKTTTYGSGYTYTYRPSVPGFSFFDGMRITVDDDGHGARPRLVSSPEYTNLLAAAKRYDEYRARTLVDDWHDRNPGNRAPYVDEHDENGTQAVSILETAAYSADIGWRDDRPRPW